MPGEASHIDLEQGAELLPGLHYFERVVAVEVVVALRMGDDDLPSCAANLTDDVVVVAHELEPKLHQQKPPAPQADVAPSHDSPHGGRIRCQDLLAQGYGGEIVLPLRGGRELVERPPMPVQLPVNGCLTVKVRHQEMRRGHNHPDSFAIEASQCGNRLCHVDGAVVHTGHEMAVEVYDREG